MSMQHAEPDLTHVIRIVGDNEDAPDEPIKLLEVNAATVATGSVEPYARSRPRNPFRSPPSSPK